MSTREQDFSSNSSKSEAKGFFIVMGIIASAMGVLYFIVGR